MAIFNNKLKFSKNFFSELKSGIKKYSTSKFAADIYLHLLAIIAVSVFIAISVSRFVSFKIFIYGLNNKNAAREKERPGALKKTGIYLYSPILKYNIPDSAINGNLISYADSGRALFASMDLSLIGTIKGAMNYAFFTDKSAGGKEIFVKQGDIIKLNYVLYGVHSKYVVISNGPAKKDIRIAKENNVSESAPNAAGPAAPFRPHDEIIRQTEIITRTIAGRKTFFIINFLLKLQIEILFL